VTATVRSVGPVAPEPSVIAMDLVADRRRRALEQLDVEQGDAQVVGRPSSQPGDQIVAAPGDQSVDGVQRQACVHALAQAQSLCGVVGERRLPLQAVGLQTRRGEASGSAATEGMPARGAAIPGTVAVGLKRRIRAT